MAGRETMKPLYQQVKEALIRKIEEGIYKPNQRIPSERQLCETFEVSRITVRQAIEAAINEGYLYRHHGKGTFVTGRQQRFEQPLTMIQRFEDLLRAQGVKGYSKVITTSLLVADIELSSTLQIPVGSPVLQMELVGISEEQPIVFYESYYVEELIQPIKTLAYKLEKEGRPFTSLDLYRHLATNKPVKVNQSMEAVIAEGKIAKHLKISEGHPLMKVTSIFVSQNEKPLEFRRAYYLGENYIFYLTRQLNW